MSKFILYTEFLFLVCLLQSESIAQTGIKLPNDHYKYRAIESVIKKIADARGDNKPLPEIVVYSVKSNSGIVAKYSAGIQPSICFDEKFYDLCTKFGSDSMNAFACIAGHELSHHYENHVWTTSFADMLNSKTGDTTSLLFTKYERIKIEAEADYFGLFYGFVAGFDNYQIFPAVLDSIYFEYHLPDNITGYPSKAERIMNARAATNEINKMTYAFDAGKFLFVTKNYELSKACFEYVLKKFPGKEIFNNIAVICLLQAVELTDKTERHFSYPFEFDPGSRLYYGTDRSLTEDKKDKINEYLESAIVSLKKAISADYLYSSAYINLACAYSLLNNNDAAIGAINEMESLFIKAKLSLPANASLVRGIARVCNGQSDKAVTDFNSAKEYGAYYIEYNYSLYEKFRQPDFGNKTEIEKFIYAWHEKNTRNKTAIEKPEASGLISEVERMQFDDTLRVVDDDLRFIIYGSDRVNYFGLKIKLNGKTFFIAKTKCNYTGKTGKEIATGMKTSIVAEKYGIVDNTVFSADGRKLFLYKDSGIIFETMGETVSGWWIFKTNYY